jgi:hypothetical protein
VIFDLFVFPWFGAAGTGAALRNAVSSTAHLSVLGCPNDPTRAVGDVPSGRSFNRHRMQFAAGSICG